MIDPERRAQHAPASIFISYKREELAYADTLRLFLEKSGYTVWWDRELQTGSAWASDLDRQLTIAACVIVLWSRRAARSAWVRHEASGAIGRGTYLPVKIEQVDVPHPFDRLQAADLVGWDGSQSHPGFRALLESLERLLARPPTSYASAPNERIAAWPVRVPRNVLVTAATWLSQNLAAMIAAVAIILLGVLVYATSNSVTRLDSQVRTVSSAVEKLHSGVKTLNDSSAQLEGLMRASGAAQKLLDAHLADQAATGVTAARKLKQATELIDTNARMTGALLDDNLKRIDAFELTIDVRVDPYKLLDPEGRRQLEKRSKVAATDPASFNLEDERPNCEPLASEDPPLPWLAEHDAHVRQQILDRWQLVVMAAPGSPASPSERHSTMEVVGRFDREGGIGSMDLLRVFLCKGQPAHLMAAYELRYRVPTRPVGGLRTYEDFLGANVLVGIHGDSSLMAPEEVSLKLGVRGERGLDAKAGPPAISPRAGDWEATFEIPADYLKRSAGSNAGAHRGRH